MARYLGRLGAAALLFVLSSLVLPARPSAAAADRCAGGDPFTPALRADIANRFPGHNITASAYDQRTGCQWHLERGRRVGTASVVKVEIGAGVLLRAQQAGRGLTQSEASRLWPMITQSSNPPTTSLWTELGGAPAMNRLDRIFGLDETTPAAPSWGLTTTSAEDQIHLLRQVVMGEGGPLDAAHRQPLIEAMGAVVPSQRWGVSAGAPPGSDVRLKNGFASSPCCAWRINSVGVVTTGGHSVALAVLSDRWPTMAAGIEAVELVSRAVNQATTRPRWVGITAAPPRNGTLAASSDGRITGKDSLSPQGDIAGQPANSPVVGIDGTTTGRGYRMVASDGGLFCFGDASFRGSMGGQPLNAPVVGMATTRSGGGYWLVALDGGIFSFGDAAFHGSTGGMPLNAPIVGMEVSSTGGGYCLIAADGGVFAFGDAPFFGAATDVFSSPVAGITTTPSGVRILAEDGSTLDRP